MTGYGDAQEQEGDRLVAAEVRTVNNRYLKVNIRCPDAYAARESEIERLVRRGIARGTVSVSVRVDSLTASARYHIDRDVLQSYFEQLLSVTDAMQLDPPNALTDFLVLPGVVVEHGEADADVEHDWPLVERVILRALEGLNAFRRHEGESMRQELLQHCGLIGSQLDQIANRAPGVVVWYRDKLKERVTQLLQGTGFSASDADLIREVSIFADRCDITEEITRLRSHLVQFGECLNQTESAGRKLEFLCQEMFREVNTIGSKSNDVVIAHAVVEMKGTVEKLREIVQNVE